MSLPVIMLPIEIELGMPSRCIFIATTIFYRRSQPRPSRATAWYTSRLGPIHQPMPHPASCEAKLGRDNSILARQQGSAVAEGPADPLRQAMLYHRGSRQPALACWLAGWMGWGINILTWVAMTRLPAALRNLVKLERRRDVALVIARRDRKIPVPSNKQLPSRHPGVGKLGSICAALPSCRATMATQCPAGKCSWP